MARWSGTRLTLVALKANKDLNYYNELFEAGALVPVIDGVYPLEKVREALRRSAPVHHHGNIIVSMAFGDVLFAEFVQRRRRSACRTSTLVLLRVACSAVMALFDPRFLPPQLGPDGRSRRTPKSASSPSAWTSPGMADGSSISPSAEMAFARQLDVRIFQH